MLLFVGLPLFFLELALGQYAQAGPVQVFGRLAPVMKGIGYAMLATTIFAAIEYVVIIAWSMHYLFSSMRSKLPWTDCENKFNSPFCTPSGMNMTCQSADKGQCISAPEDYFNARVLNLNKDNINWGNLGGLQWELVGCLLVAWVMVCLTLIKGVKSSGKVVYFTAVFPYVVLGILLFRALSLDGAMEGITWYLTPNPEIMLNHEVWEKAATQIFYSLCIGLGGLITLSSYNKFDNNCHRDAMVIVMCNACTSFFSGIVVFSILGFMSKSTGKSIEDVASEGLDLVFIVFPEGLTLMELPQLWSILFFMMLITLGIDVTFADVETISTSIIDHFKFRNRQKSMVVIGICVAGFLLGLSMVTQGGLYMFTLIDSTAFSWNLLLFALLEVTLVAWIYGIDPFFKNLEEMNIRLWSPVKWYWIVCWKFVTPIILSILLLTSLSAGLEIEIDGYTFPDEIHTLGWMITSSTVAMIPIVAFCQIAKICRNGQEIGSVLFKPKDTWSRIESMPEVTNIPTVA